MSKYLNLCWGQPSLFLSFKIYPFLRLQVASTKVLSPSFPKIFVLAQNEWRLDCCLFLRSNQFLSAARSKVRLTKQKRVTLDEVWNCFEKSPNKPNNIIPAQKYTIRSTTQGWPWLLHQFYVVSRDPCEAWKTRLERCQTREKQSRKGFIPKALSLNDSPERSTNSRIQQRSSWNPTEIMKLL